MLVLLTRVESRLQRCESVIFEHVQQSLLEYPVDLSRITHKPYDSYRLSSIVETQEEYLCILVGQTCNGELITCNTQQRLYVPS